jgi:hypothetical protein
MPWSLHTGILQVHQRQKQTEDMESHELILCLKDHGVAHPGFEGS